MEPLELPTDRPRSLASTGAVGTAPVTIPAALAKRLRVLAERQGTSLSAVVLAAHVLVLSCWTRRDDITVGAVQADLSGDPTFAELVRQLANTDGTLEFVTEELTIRLCEVDGELAGVAEFVADLFDTTTINRLVGHLLTVLRTACADPERRISGISPLSPDERAQLLGDFVNTTEPYPDGVTLHQRVEAQVARTPDATALVRGDTSVTYRELNSRANQLARWLRAEGIGTGALVAVCLERGPDLIVSLLAVLKAGAAYVPIDPVYPVRRIEFMLTDTKAALVITDSVLRRRLHGIPTEQLLIDQDRPPVDDTDLPAGAGPDDLAYLIYTSGSTGTPKGVMVEHRSIVNFTRLLPERLRITPHSRVLQFTSPSFDVSLAEIFGTLLAGATLVLAPRDALKAGGPLEDTVVSQRVSVLIASPSLLAALSPESLAGIRTLVVGGEPCTPDIAATWRSGRLLVNAYGPTETTVGATFHHFTEKSQRVVIGRPNPNTSAYVVDPRGGLVPVGVPGELWIGGVGVARGYWNRPELTAEMFIPDPFTGSGRVYRTGDLVRWLPSGELEFVGRVDEQVKIRGFRVELGEIQAVLARHTAVRHAAVIVREDRPGDRRLVAYLVTGANIAEIRRYLSDLLPEHMVPSAFVVMDSLPRTANGKLDREALPAPEQTVATIRPARTPRQEILCGLVADVLGLESVGLDDQFFELGGHSLLAARLISGIRRTLGVELGIRDLFQAPTVAGLSECLDRRLAAPARPAVRATERPEPIPLSYAQSRLWFLNQLEGGGATYTVQFVLRLYGDLDVSSLRMALSDVVDRHESLRTIYPSVDGRPRQRILQPGQARLAFTVTDTYGDLREELRAEAAHAFDLATELPIRARLFAEPAERLLMVVMHHIASDGWSVGRLVRDLAAAYQARLDHDGPAWPALPVQYADYAVWQQDLLGDADDPDSLLAKQLNFWKARLDGCPEQLELPASRRRPAVPSHRGDTVSVRIGPELHARLLEISRACGVTLFMVLQAGFAALLTRFGAGTDIPIGSPVAGRPDEALDELVGFFVNTLVLRTDTSGDPTFRELLARVRETDLAAYEHDDVPFERLVEELNPTRSLSRHPLFQVMFVLQNQPAARYELPGLTVEPEPVDITVARFDLTLALTERDHTGGIDGFLEFATDLFDKAMVESLVSHLIRLLDVVVADPDAPIGRAELLAADDRRTLLVDWNDTAMAAPTRCVHQVFEDRCARTPDATALVFGAERITYQELNARANRLAHHLLDQGVGGGQVVGVLLDRNVSLVVAVLAVLKAGAGYTMLDPRFPTERLVAIARQARLGALVTDRPLDVDALKIGLEASGRTDNLDVPVDPSSVACVMFTSGSTGVPKGVVSPHRAMVATLVGQSYVDFAADAVWLQCSPVSWDAFALELFGALLSGATCVLQPGPTPDPAVIAELVPKHAIDTLHVSASLLNFLVDEYPDTFARVRQVMTGGESASVSHVDRLLRLRPGLRLVNGYSPVENMIFTLCHQITTADVERPSIPVGRPIPGKRVYVLDGHLAPVPVGVAGELYMAGIGLAGGYIGQPELTAERFVDDSFGEPGDRMYRTGDLVRWLPDGVVEFLGRVDDQVKIRGFRIEPGEIETVLNGHPGIVSVAVAVCGTRLVAYCVPASGQVDQADLRAWCQRTLPDYMVPSVFLSLDALPLTANGKLDRRALPAPAGGREDLGTTYVAPRNDLEASVAEVWADVLGMDKVGVHDNFFAIGGHSLLATRVVNRMAQHTALSPSLKQFFLTPTVAELAAGPSGTAVTPLLPRPSGAVDVELSFAQQRLWFLDQLNSGGADYVVPCAFRIRGPLDVSALASAFSGLVARHEVLRTRFVVGDDGRPRQVVTDPWQVPITIVDLTGREDDAIALVDAEAVRPFDLTSGRLVRVLLVQFGAAERLLLVSMHHIVTDGWSMGVVGRE